MFVNTSSWSSSCVSTRLYVYIYICIPRPFPLALRAPCARRFTDELPTGVTTVIPNCVLLAGEVARRARRARASGARRARAFPRRGLFLVAHKLMTLERRAEEKAHDVTSMLCGAAP